MPTNIGGALFNSSGDKYAATSSPSAHSITGDLSLAATITPTALPSSNAADWAVFSLDSGETEATNALYGLGIRNNGGTSYWSYFHEYGSGNNKRVDSDVVVGGTGVRQTVVIVRDISAKTIKFIVDGVDEGDFGYSDNPTGGADTNFTIGKSASGGQEIQGTVDGVVLWDAALSVVDAQKYDAVYTGGLANLTSFVNDIDAANLVCYYQLTSESGANDLLGDATLGLTGTGVTVTPFTTDFTSPNLNPNAAQGYATDGTDHWIFDTDRFSRHDDDASWTELDANTSPFTGLVGSPDHLGDGCVDDTYVYAATSNYPLTTANNLVKYNKSDLSRHSSISLSAARGTSSVGINPSAGLLYVSNFTDSTIDIYTTDLVYQSTINITPYHDEIQGVTYKNGWLYCLDTHGVLLIVKPSDGTLVYRKDLGSDIEYEGVDFTQDEFRYLSKVTGSEFTVKYLSDVPASAGGSTVSVAPPSGSLSYTGQVPTVSTSDNQVVVPSSGSMGYTGLAPVVTGAANIAVSPPAGSVSYTGQLPAVSVSDAQLIEPGTGVVTYTGFAPAVSIGDSQTVTPPAGSVSYTGFAPSVVADGSVEAAPPSGAVAYTGHAPSLSVSEDQIIAVPFGTVSYSGFAPLISVGDAQTVVPPVGVVTYTGFAPTVSVSEAQVVEPPAAAIIYTGFVPAISIGNAQVVEPPSGTVSYIGFAPTATASGAAVIRPATGAVGYTGYVPAVSASNDVRVFPSAGTVTYLGFAPTFRQSVKHIPRSRLVGIPKEQRYVGVGR